MSPRDPKSLTKKALQVLKWLADHKDGDDGELVCDRLECWYGLNRTNRATVHRLLECAFISKDVLGGSGAEHYTINGSGERFLKGLPPYRDSEGKYHETLFTILFANAFQPKKISWCRLRSGADARRNSGIQWTRTTVAHLAHKDSAVTLCGLEIGPLQREDVTLRVCSRCKAKT